jgi:hypothetical protein
MVWPSSSRSGSMTSACVASPGGVRIIPAIPRFARDSHALRKVRSSHRECRRARRIAHHRPSHPLVSPIPTLITAKPPRALVRQAALITHNLRLAIATGALFLSCAVTPASPRAIAFTSASSTATMSDNATAHHSLVGGEGATANAPADQGKPIALSLHPRHLQRCNSAPTQ